jgi:ribosomal protein S18 acetylase RimI-like enzyme
VSRTVIGNIDSAVANYRLRDDVSPSDVQAVRRIVERTGYFRDDEVQIAVELVEERLARGPNSGYHFIFADCGDEIAGYACYGPIACTIGSYDLFWIAVEPQFQGQGIGQTLMLAVESRIVAAGGRGIYIDTSGREQYAPTRAFYERCGYQREARLKDFYSPGDDRVIYVKTLSGPTESD